MAKTQPHTIVIPPTHFMQACIDKNKEKWKEQIKNAWASVFLGNITADAAMEQLGLMLEGDIAKEIKEVNEPPLAQGTIQNRLTRKANKKLVGGLTKRLIDTGEMFGAVSHKVTKK